mmetsp:Transcript_25405/g.55526  ORF Transcript_25405/g.55526 Transcript_25405/m.55526 type:complete len:220 (-) Transcript_25405:141-800(-)
MQDLGEATGRASTQTMATKDQLISQGLKEMQNHRFHLMQHSIGSQPKAFMGRGSQGTCHQNSIENLLANDVQWFSLRDDICDCVLEGRSAPNRQHGDLLPGIDGKIVGHAARVVLLVVLDEHHPTSRQPVPYHIRITFIDQLRMVDIACQLPRFLSAAQGLTAILEALLGDDFRICQSHGLGNATNPPHHSNQIDKGQGIFVQHPMGQVQDVPKPSRNL